MEVIIAADAEAAARVVADHFEHTVRAAGDRGAVLGLATGSSPVPTYRELIRRHREEGLSFARCRAFLLDEYVGLPADHHQSYHHFIREQFIDHVDLDDAVVSSPDGGAANSDQEARRYDQEIAEAGGIDLQILGIGSNGHIAFNEPGSSLQSRTRVITLTEQTINDNSRYFDSADDVPIQALTQGLGTIGEARKVILTACGDGKAEAVAHMVEGPVSARWPATALQMHNDATIVIDEAAASQLEFADYYRFAYRMAMKRGAAHS